MKKLMLSTIILLAGWHTTIQADDFSAQIVGEKNTREAQRWVSVCLINLADTNLEPAIQFGYQAKPEKWKTYKIADGNALIIGQTFLDGLEAPKVWVKLEGTDGAEALTEGLSGKVTQFRPRRCQNTQRAAFVEETDGHLTIKVLP